MVSLFKTKSAAAVVWITLLCIFVHLPFIFEGPQIMASGNDTILDRLLSSFTNISGVAIYLLYLIIVSLQANRINAAVNNLSLFQKENALAGMVYVLFTAILPQWNNISSTLIINTLFIEILASLRILHSMDKPEKLIFNLTLLTSIGIILYPPSAIWAVVLLCALVSLSSFKFRLIIVWLIAVILPFYFLAAYLFLTDNFSKILQFVPTLKFHVPSLKKEAIVYLISFGFVIVTVFLGIFSGQQNSGKLLIASRKIWGLLTLAFLLTVGNAFLYPNEFLPLLLFAIINASLLGANLFFHASSKWMATIWFWMIVIAIYYTNLHNLHIIRF